MKNYLVVSTLAACGWWFIVSSTEPRLVVEMAGVACPADDPASSSPWPDASLSMARRPACRWLLRAMNGAPANGTLDASSCAAASAVRAL